MLYTAIALAATRAIHHQASPSGVCIHSTTAVTVKLTCVITRPQFDLLPLSGLATMRSCSSIRWTLAKWICPGAGHHGDGLLTLLSRSVSHVVAVTTRRTADKTTERRPLMNHSQRCSIYPRLPSRWLHYIDLMSLGVKRRPPRTEFVCCDITPYSLVDQEKFFSSEKWP